MPASVGRNTEITARSDQSFEDAIRIGIERATSTLRNVSSAWIKEQQVKIEGDSVREYQVTMIISFVLDDASPTA